MQTGTITRARTFILCTGLLSAWMVTGCEPAAQQGLPAARPSAVSVTITTQPPGASIVIDGTPLGAGPLTVKLNPGPHRLKAAKSGYFSADQKLIVASGDAPRSIELTLVSSH